MDQINLFHLFSFVPVILVGGILWFERMARHGAQRRTLFLFFSLLTMAILGIFQTLAWTMRPIYDTAGALISGLPHINLQVFVISCILYYVSFMSLEYAIHSKRIDESFLTPDFMRGMKKVWILGIILFILVALISFYWSRHTQKPSFFLEMLFLGDANTKNIAIQAYYVNIKVLNVVFTLFFAILVLVTARSVYNLQEGVIRMRGYPFYTMLVVALGLAIFLLTSDEPVRGKSTFFPQYWFGLLNLVFAIRVVEEFFFWSQYNLRSDRAKLEQRQHALNLLIRRVITSSEEEDKVIIAETIENAKEKMKSRMVVAEYNITGVVTYRVHGNLLKVDAPDHLIGYCTPLNDQKNFKNFDKKKLNDEILRTVYNLKELRETSEGDIKDWGLKLVKQTMSAKEPIILEELPENYRGLQRLIGLIPVLDGNNFMGFVQVFKDSFFKLYPAEKEILSELSENLGTIFALMNGKEIQRERNRLQGEMNTARNIQTSILPKKLAMPGYSIETYMETATEVGGDAYDLVPTPYGTYFSIGDVAGHGLPAGMMAVISTSAMHGALEASKSLAKPIAPDTLFEVVNRTLCTINRDRIGSDKFMTHNYFVEKDGVITHSGAHLVALVYRAKSNTVEEITKLIDNTAFLGISELVSASQSLGSFKLDSGDILMLYTDGAIEAKNAQDVQFNMENLIATFLDNHEKSLKEIIESVLEALKKWAAGGDIKRNGGHFSDDVTLFMIKKD